MNIQKLTIEEFVSAGGATSIKRLLAPSYETDPSALIARAFGHTTDVYTGWVRDELVAFFMVSWETLSVQSIDEPSVYLGLSGEGADHKTTDVAQLYMAFINDAQAWEQTSGRRLVLWGTTATPSAFRAVEVLFGDGQPTRAGLFTDQARQGFDAIRSAHFPTSEQRENDPPYLLRGVAHDTRYAAAERARIAHIEHKHGFTLFQNIKLDEAHGDRILFVCRTPATN